MSKSGFSIYEGLEVTGWPHVTIRRGKVVYEEDQITARPGTGQLLRRGPFQAL